MAYTVSKLIYQALIPYLFSQPAENPKNPFHYWYPGKKDL